MAKYTLQSVRMAFEHLLFDYKKAVITSILLLVSSYKPYFYQ